MEDINKNKNLILTLILVMLMFAGIALYNYRNQSEQKVETTGEKENYKLLKDYSRFFTVNSCVYKYVQYLQKEDFDSLFKVLDEDYVVRTSINKNNVYSFLPNISDGVYNYVSKKIYYEKINDNLIVYYVYGYIEKSVLDSVGFKEYHNYEVILDTKNETFSIAPYNGNLFDKEVANG